ncbi:MAG: efflux RND transporter periplasmic adaptor subunit [Pseudomonadaceae bacterium]|nr:efflux RND transporter periplasmic adaptor subunit [Pseudomonadaceae bacterium]
MIKQILVAIVIIIIAGLGAATLMATAPVLEPNNPVPLPTTIRVREVTPEALRLTVQSQGSVSPSKESHLIPEVSGRVVWMSESLVVGGSFDKGDPLLRLDATDTKSALTRASAALKRAEAEQQHAKFEHQRLLSLEARQLVSRSQLENALRVLRISEASLDDARAAFRQAQIDLNRTTITAPFDGLVRSESVDVGQFIGRGTNIGTIYASDSVEVRLPLADSQLAYLALPVGVQGQIAEDMQPNVTLSAYYAGQDLTWTGKIVRTESEIDSRSRMINVVARVDTTSQAIPLAVGLFVEATIEGALAREVVVLPRSALRNGEQVLVVDSDNRLQFRDVKLLRLHKDEVLIRSGLQAGERVCVSPLQTAVDGMRVETIADA